MNGHTIPNTPIAVDFWKIRQNHRSKIFFLSHCHADHMEGLSSTWCRPIYCSEVTAEILKYKLNVRADLLHPLEFNTGHIIPLDEEGLETMTVNLIDANHCPGAAMFLFEGYFGKILYTGDFRFHNDIFKEIPHAKENIDILYLDNTYCSPSCVFPPRENCERDILKIVAENPDAEQIIIGVRNLGKEDLLVKIAEQNQEWIGVSANMLKTAEIMNLPEVFTTEATSCRIRTQPVHLISAKNVTRWSAEQKTVVILPSAMYIGVSGAFSNFDNVYIIPYSDHSSYSELIQFVSILKPKRVIPIVSGNAKGPLGSSLQDCSKMDCFSGFLDQTLLKLVVVPPSVLFKKSRNETGIISQSAGRGSLSKVYWNLHKIRSRPKSSNMGVSFLDSAETSQEQYQEKVVSPDSTSSTMEEGVLVGDGNTVSVVATEQNFGSQNIGETKFNRPDSTKIHVDIEPESVSNTVQQNSIETDNLKDFQDHTQVSSSQSQESFFDCHDEIPASGKSHYSTPQGNDVDYDNRNLHEEIHKNSDGALTKSELTHHKIDIYFKDDDLMSDVSEINQCAENKNSCLCKMAVKPVMALVQVYGTCIAEEYCPVSVSSQTGECFAKDIECERDGIKVNTENVHIDSDRDIEFDEEPLHEETNNSIDTVKQSAQKSEGHRSFAESNKDVEISHGQKVTLIKATEKHESKNEKANTLPVADDLSDSYEFSTQPFVPGTCTAISPDSFALTQSDESAQEFYTESSCFDFCTQPFVPHEDILQSDNSFVIDRCESVKQATDCGTSTSCKLNNSSNQTHLRDCLNSDDQSDCDTDTPIHLQESSNPIGQLPGCSLSATQSDEDDVNQSKKHINELENSADNTLNDDLSGAIVASEENTNTCITIQSSPDVIDSSLPNNLCIQDDLIVCMSKGLESDFSQNTPGEITQNVDETSPNSIESIPYGNKNNSSIRMDIETRSLSHCEQLTIKLSDSSENMDKNTYEMSPSTELNSSNMSKGKKKSTKLCRKRLRLLLEDTDSENKIEKQEINTCKRRKSDKESVFANPCLVGSKTVRNTCKSNSKQTSSIQSITSFFRPVLSSTYLEDQSDHDGLQQEQYQKIQKSTERILLNSPSDISELESSDGDNQSYTKSTSKIDNAGNENIECESLGKVLKRAHSPIYSVIPISRKRTKLDRHKSLLKTYEKFCSY